jgi:hypothetical protein
VRFYVKDYSTIVTCNCFIGCKYNRLIFNAGSMLGEILVTKQSGPAGKPVNQVNEILSILKLRITID